ncbi:S8 family serine peptidase [Archangium gephyra]|nr:S8 family serine peptidase [Archangium gephyra]
MKTTSRALSSWVVALGLAGSGGALAAAPEVARVAGEEQVRAVGGEIWVEPDLLEIKFHENQYIRLRNGLPMDLGGRGLRHAQAHEMLRQVAGGKWSRSHEAAEEVLEELRSEGELRTREVLPDLNLYFQLRLPAGMDVDRIAESFRKLPEVEAVYRVPRPAPSPVAPDYYSVSSGSYQKYQDAAPTGVDSRYASTLAGALGTGVKICDVEYSYNASHADLGVVTLVGSAPVDPFSNNNHGTAVLGVYGATANGEGVTGIAHSAQKLFAAANTASGYNVGAAVTTCAANISAGDIIVIEQQMSGPISGKYVPVEWYKPWYDAIRTAVAANKIVVEAAGNGSQNLDDPMFSTGNNGHYPFLAQNDSGAIIVGAGKSPAYGTAARSAHDFSTYGSTVDLQGWGDGVVTTGYGTLYSAEGVNRYFANGFNGTSSATPVVAGSVASLQGRYKSLYGTYLTPASVKSRLRTYGTAQTGTKNIGPLPDLRRALTGL